MDMNGSADQVLTLNDTEWQYRGEGNANLVLSLPQQRCVLRLRKHDSGHCDNGVDSRADSDLEGASREALFCHAVMVPLLGDAYIQPPATVVLDAEEVSCLEAALHPHRPSHRNHKGLRRHPRHTYAMLYPDYALLPSSLSSTSDSSSMPTFCIEVKPKQGWVPCADRRLPRCTFCLNQFLKLQKRTIRNTSSYCPLDLFSGNRDRANQALRSLLITPQNNLKIFRNGLLVYGDGNEISDRLECVLREWVGDPEGIDPPSRLVNKACELIWEALTRNLSSAPPPEATPVLSSREVPDLIRPERVCSVLVSAVAPILPLPACDWSAEPLPEGCILERVLRVQKLEQMGADTVYWEYISARQQGDYAYVEELLSGNPFGRTSLHRYLLATTAKDCSIMLAFQQLGCTRSETALPLKNIVSDHDARNYVFSVGVSDLDPKPASCVEKHRKRDCEILNACLEFLQQSNVKVAM